MVMRPEKLLLSFSAFAALAGCAGGETTSGPLPLDDKQAKLYNKQISGKTPGAAVRCISQFQQANMIRVSDDLLLYRVSGRLVYENRLKSPCPGLADDSDIIVSEQYGGQQCSGDLLRLVDRVGGIPGPVCVLGDFVPYRKDGKVAAE
jgi:hypothetical protein